MRITVDLPEQLYRKIKAHASLNGISMKAYISAALQHEVEGSILNLDRRKVNLPLVASKSPGSINLDGEKIADIL